MKDLVLTSASTEEIEKTDRLYAQRLRESRKQYVDFCNQFLSKVPGMKKYLPYEKESFSLLQLSSDFEEARSEIQETIERDGDLIIEVTYEELRDEST